MMTLREEIINKATGSGKNFTFPQVKTRVYFDGNWETFEGEIVNFDRIKNFLISIMDSEVINKEKLAKDIINGIFKAGCVSTNEAQDTAKQNNMD